MENENRKTGPYPGLRPFQADESRIFFGREDHCEQLLEKLAHNRMISVVGPSGCGKSSLVKAGLISDLMAGYMEAEFPDWEIATMRPGRWPLANLARAFRKALNAPDPSPEAAFKTQYVFSDFMDEIERVGFPEDENLLLLVDQFEEIFRFLEEIDFLDARSFVSLILDLAAQEKYPIYVVMTMRSDFLGECALFQGLPEAINQGLFLTPRLNHEQLRDAILGPARVFGGEVHPSLVNQLIDEVGPDPDQLPLMQHVLMRVYDEETCGGPSPSCEENPGMEKKGSGFDFELTLDTYNRIGGMTRALSNHANKTLELATKKIENAKYLAEVLFRCLIKRDEGQRDLRNPVKISYVAEVAGVDMETIEKLIRFFKVPGFIFTTRLQNDKKKKQARLIDISHECLIRQWDRMRGEKSEKFDKSGWVKKEAKKAGIYALLAEEAEYWNELSGQNAWTQRYWQYLAGSRTLNIADILKKREMPNRAWAKKYDIALSNEKDKGLKSLYLDVMANRGDEALYRDYKTARKKWCRDRFDLTMKYLKFSRRYAFWKWPVLVVTVVAVLTGMSFWVGYSDRQILAFQKKADAFAREENFNGAEIQYQNAIALDGSPQLWLARFLFRYSPKADLHNGLAHVYIRKAEIMDATDPSQADNLRNKAIDESIRAIGKDEHNIVAMNFIAALRMEMIVSGRGEDKTQEWLTDAEEKYTHVIGQDQKNIDSLKGLVNLYLYRRDFDRAETMSQNAYETLKGNRSRLDMDLMRISRSLGDLYVKKGRYENALKFYGETYRFDPKNPCILNRIGSVYSKMDLLKSALGNYRKAEALFDNQGVELNLQDRVSTYNGMGAVYIKQGQFEKAREKFNKALDALSGPENGPDKDRHKAIAYNGLGAAYLGEGYWDEGLGRDYLTKAHQAFSKALAHLPPNVKGSVFEGLIHVGNGKALSGVEAQTDAAASFKKACDIDQSVSEDVPGIFMKNNPGLAQEHENNLCE